MELEFDLSDLATSLAQLPTEEQRALLALLKGVVGLPLNALEAQYALRASVRLTETAPELTGFLSAQLDSGRPLRPWVPGE